MLTEQNRASYRLAFALRLRLSRRVEPISPISEVNPLFPENRRISRLPTLADCASAWLQLPQRTLVRSSSCSAWQTNLRFHPMKLTKNRRNTACSVQTILNRAVTLCFSQRDQRSRLLCLRTIPV